MLNCKCVKKSFDELIAGNKKFVSDTAYKKQRRGGQPGACTVVVSCPDSCVPASIIFGNNNLGYFFEVKSVGQTIDADDIESIKYAMIYLKAKLIVIIGHSGCHAIQTTVESITDSKIRSQFPNIIRDILPSVTLTIKRLNLTPEEISKSQQKLINQSTIQNALDKAQTIAYLLNLKYGEHVKAGIYDPPTGQVTWYDENHNIIK
ncbi:MAG: carbonic anhydrase 2 [Harvfovirus sp.]|uniref:carbonic anhydrase n=1 Tax=Harvfovirus sp. TaxID=2487768 RepID=A0A3G5A2W0_9VIRU|nr:MAG: carbonic anhydrase 2 [Harvfovirus sp.]